MYVMDKLAAQEQRLADYLLAEVRKVVREELDAGRPVSAPVPAPVPAPRTEWWPQNKKKGK